MLPFYTTLPEERSGVLLGFNELNPGEAVIVDFPPLPPDGRHSTGHFERGVEGLLVKRLQQLLQAFSSVAIRLAKGLQRQCQELLFSW